MAELDLSVWQVCLQEIVICQGSPPLGILGSGLDGGC